MIAMSREVLDRLADRAPVKESRISTHSLVDASGSSHCSADVIARARAYLATIDPATSGERGHDKTFYAANRLIRGFGLSVDAAFPLFAEWNQKCKPPWTDYDLRRKLEQAERQTGSRGFLLGAKPRATSGDGAKKFGPLRNFIWEEVPDGETMRKVRIARSANDIAQELLDRKYGWPKRCGPRLFVIDSHDKVEFLRQPEELFGWMHLALDQGNGSPLDWVNGSAHVGKGEFRVTLSDTVDRFEAIGLYPHEPPIPGYYYHHSPVIGGNGEALRGLLSQLKPATTEDEELVRTLLLTLIWGGPAGSRPAFLISAEEDAPHAGRGAGKTKLAEKLASLVGGVVKVSPSQDFAKWRDSFVSAQFAGGTTSSRVVLIDNLKTLKFTNEDIESLITSQTIDGHLLYHGLASVPNHLTIIITGNAPSLGKDLSQRVIPIQIKAGDFDPQWETNLDNYIEANRWAIIGDLIAELSCEPQQMTDCLRWATWCGAVLARSGNLDGFAKSDGLVKLVRERQERLDADEDTAESIRAVIVVKVKAAIKRLEDEGKVNLLHPPRWEKQDPETTAVRITNNQLADFYNLAFGENKPVQRVTSEIKHTLQVRGLRWVRLANSRGWEWRGDLCPKDVTPWWLNGKDYEENSAQNKNSDGTEIDY
jgi:hypothetical protein